MFQRTGYGHSAAQAFCVAPSVGPPPASASGLGSVTGLGIPATAVKATPVLGTVTLLQLPMAGNGRQLLAPSAPTCDLISTTGVLFCVVRVVSYALVPPLLPT